MGRFDWDEPTYFVVHPEVEAELRGLPRMKQVRQWLGMLAGIIAALPFSQRAAAPPVPRGRHGRTRSGPYTSKRRGPDQQGYYGRPRWGRQLNGGYL